MENTISIGEDRGTTPWGLVILLVGTGIVSAFQIGKIPGILPVLRAEFNLDLFLASWIISILNVIGAAGGVVMGAIADRIGYRRLIITGLLFMAMGNIIGALTSKFSIFLITRFIEGIGFFYTVLSAASIITRIVHPKDLRFTLGIWGAYMPSGFAMMLFVSPLFATRIGWRGLWYMNAFLCLALILWFGFSIRNLSKGRPPRVKDHIKIWPNIKTTFSSPGPLLLGLCFFCYGGQWMALMTFLPTFFIEAMGFSKGNAALLTALPVIVNIPGNIAGGWLLQRNISRGTLLSFAFIVAALCSFWIYSYDTHQIVRLVLCLVFSFVGGIIPASLLAGVPLHTPGKDLLGSTYGLLVQGSNLGTMIMPPALAAVVGLWGGWHGAPLIFILSGFIGLVASIGIGRLERV